MTTKRQIIFDMYMEYHETPCPVCGDTMTIDHDNVLPTWSDPYDNVVCWWCAVHHPDHWQDLDNN